MSTIIESDTELLILIRSFRAAMDAGDRTQAVRDIDRAHRLAPENPEINHLYGRLLLADGSFDKAAAVFSEAADTLPQPDFAAAAISALCAAGDVAAARGRLEKALARFTVTPDGPLAKAAHDVVRACAAECPGWIGVAPNLDIHGEIAGGRPIAWIRIARDGAVIHRQRVQRSEKAEDTTRFLLQGRNRLLHGRRLHGRPLTATVNNTPLFGGALTFPPDFGLDGRAVTADGEVTGWVTLRWDPYRALELSVSGKGGFSRTVKTSPDPHQLGRHLFSLDADTCAKAGNVITIRAILPDGRREALPDAPLLIAPKRRPPVHRRKVGPASRDGLPVAGAARPVDILIPVYSGVAETLTCIRSVIATAPPGTTVIVIDDASPDPAMAPALDALATAGSIMLLRNPRNLGFPRTANRGLKLHPDRDIVILNADTEVFGDWLERLTGAAYRDPRTGTVTPLTNSGTIASYPASEEPALDSDTAGRIDRLAAAQNRGAAVEIPTGVGFCLYVKRDCLAEVGYFDAVTFRSGYGEENDFCLRARKAGWRHLLATDLYVRHSGSRSFGTRRAALSERNLRLLNLRYPGYDAEIQTFLRSDPAQGARRRLDEARLRAAGGRHVLLVSLGLLGGVQRAVNDRMALARGEGMSPILLRPDADRKDHCTLTVDQTGFDDLRYAFADEDLDALFVLLGKLDIARVELHHFLDLAPTLIDRLYELDCPVDIKLHDYAWYCPRVTLLDGRGRYCGEPDAQACQACIEQNGHRLDQDITILSLRARSETWLKKARSLAVPAPSVARRMTAQFPGLAFDVEPHEPFFAAVGIAPSVRKQIKVAVIGSIGDHKGYDLLLDMAKDVADRELPIEFVVIGHTKEDRPLFDTGAVFVTGEYQEAEIGQLIARENPDLALFLSRFPETWCYTLTHALRAHVPVAALDDLGAIGDRLRAATDQPLLYSPKSTARELTDRLMTAFRVLPHRTTAPQPLRQDAKWLPARPTLVFNSPTPLNTAGILRIDMAQQSTAFSAAVEVLPLAKGLYVFSVRSAYAQSIQQKGLKLPALHIGTAPGAPLSQVELMPGPQTASTWLCEPYDQIIVKVKDPSAAIVMTSVVIPGMRPLEVDVRRLDTVEPARPPIVAAAAPQLAPAQSARGAPPLPATQQSVRLRITSHVQNRGDIAFSEAQWAGLIGQRLWLESFTILPLENVSPDMIEYKGITATGVETPWVAGGASCGTRGIGVPLIGFAVRPKPQAGGSQLSCQYGAILLSGAQIGPGRNGSPCRSPNVSDAIEGIWVAISVSAPSATEPVAEPKLVRPKAGDKKARAEVAPPPPDNGSADKKHKAPIGPRFSKFRDPEEGEKA